MKNFDFITSLTEQIPSFSQLQAYCDKAEIFGKYGAIFQYFDSLLIGLTATPGDEIDKNTFRLLELEDEPNIEYTFDEAVKDGYLEPYKVKNCTSKAINRGIRYNELTQAQREQLEQVWEYEKMQKGIPPGEDYHRDIEGNELFRYLINDDTIFGSI